MSGYDFHPEAAIDLDEIWDFVAEEIRRLWTSELPGRLNDSGVLRQNNLPNAPAFHPHARVAERSAHVAFAPSAFVDSHADYDDRIAINAK